MATKVENLNIYQKLSRIRKQVEVLQKNKSGYGYRYVSLDEYLAKITALMETYHLALIPSVVHGSVEVTPHSYKKTKLTKAGQAYEENVNEIIVKADTFYTWINDDNPDENVVVPWTMTGSQSDPSQAFGGGMSYSFRYFLANYFQSAQVENDVDQWRSKRQAAEASEDREIAANIIQEVDTMVRAYLSTHPKDDEKVKRFIGRFVRDSDYNKIHDPRLAGTLLHEFKDEFIKEEE